MKKNMGTLDRVLRTLAALAVLWFYYMGMISGLTAIILFVVAAIFLLTSIVGFCPLYSLLGVNSCGSKTKINQQG
ncbi:MAG: YgaP family membrane protein [Flavisolibacter sp.]